MGDERDRDLESVLLSKERPRQLFSFPPDSPAFQEVVFRREEPFSPGPFSRTSTLPLSALTPDGSHHRASAYHPQRSPKMLSAVAPMEPQPLAADRLHKTKIEKQAGKLLEKLAKRQSILGVSRLSVAQNSAGFRISGEDMTPYENAESLKSQSDWPDSTTGGPSKLRRKKRGKIWNALSALCDKLGLQRLLLICLTIGYTFLGGAIFFWLEHQPEQDVLAAKRLAHLERRNNFTEKLLFVFMHECHEGKFEEQYGLCQKFVASALLEYDKASKAWPIEEPLYRWDYWNAMFYSVTLYTTIGYGNMSCRTFSGQLATILYAFIGIPLMLTLLNDLGKMCQHWCDFGWLFLIGLKTRIMNRIRRRSPEEAQLPSVSEGFPVWLAIMIVFLYVFLCASIFMSWEKQWTYFNAFYFFFISLSTIGLGDVLPNNPHFTLASVFLFILGLALVSMVINVMQQRVEAKYLAALEMLEEAYLTGDDSIIEPRSPGAESTTTTMGIMRVSTRKKRDSTTSDEPPRPSPHKLSAIAEV